MNFDDFCIICLENIQRKDAIWSCSTCYAEYHIVCINDWIRKHKASKGMMVIEERTNLNLTDGHENARNRLNRLIDDANLWSCPKCRNNFSSDEIPNTYYCYCGKSKNPIINDWSEPHTCGEICGKYLKPYCGDTCMELCHRGPCGPCPKMLKEASCYCKRKVKNSIRCSQRFWSCEKPCGKLLSCSVHSCNRPCHTDLCNPCQELVIKECLCGANSKEVNCSEDFKCSKRCKPIDLSLKNKCPCGRVDLDKLYNTTSNGDHFYSSSLLLTTCHNTCNKVLECGQHYCYNKCHEGDCSTCKQLVTKMCKCGRSTSAIACSKEFSCQRKCERLRNCGKHKCKRKCCDPNGSCQPCELICNNLMNCRKHRCQLACHRGPCYPCQKMTEVSCACGANIKRIGCGVDTKYIQNLLTNKCVNKCLKPSQCHHSNDHKCHSDEQECPPCSEKCQKNLPCSHKCKSMCHESVKKTIKLDKSKLSGPWEALNDGKVTFEKESCPQCEEPIGLICMGAHDRILSACWKQLKSISCGRQCGRLLSCTNHHCELECHPVTDGDEGLTPKYIIDDVLKVPASSSYCQEPCQKPCSRKRDCPHPCPLPLCHASICPPCTRYLSHKCHCGALTLHLECRYGPNPPSEMLSCPSRCPMFLPLCGHRCPLNCHQGTSNKDCTKLQINPCKSKVAKYCPCGRNKQSIACWKAEMYQVKCDDNKCNQNKSKGIQSDKEFDDKLDTKKVSPYVWFYSGFILSLFIVLLAIICYFCDFLVK